MNRLFYILLDIIRLRRGPQDLPAGWTPVIAFAGISLAMGWWFVRGEQPDLTPLVAELLLAALMTATALQMVQHPERIPQTLLALFGTGVLLSLPLVVIFGGFDEGNTAVIRQLASLGYLALLAWSLTVDSHIYRHALSVTMPVGAAVAIGFFLMRRVIIGTFWPGPAG